MFTTLEEDREEILKIYGLRWNVETGIGSLKGAPRLDQLTSKNQAAQQAGVAPRSSIFTRVKRMRKVYGAKIAGATAVEEDERLLEEPAGLCKRSLAQHEAFPKAEG